MTELQERILASLTSFDVPENIHGVSDAVSSFAFFVNGFDAEDTINSMIMAVVKAVHDSCPNATFRYDAIRSLKIKVESYFLQYEEIMQNEQHDVLQSFTTDISPMVEHLMKDTVKGEGSDAQ